MKHKNMKILHIGNLKSGIDTYVRNIVALANDNFEFVIVNGADDNSDPYMRHGKPLPQYSIDMYRALNPFKDIKADKYGWEKEVWLGECGMHTAPDTTKTNKWSNKVWLEQEQAHRLPRIYLISFAYGINKVYWYEIRAEEKEPYNKEHHFGLLHSDLSPKPASIQGL